MLIFNVVSNVDLLCRFPMLFLMLIFNVVSNVDLLCRFPNKFFLCFFYFLMVDITLFFLPFSRFRYLFSNNFLLNIILYLFFLFLSLMFFFLSIFYSFFAKSYIFYYDNVGPPYLTTLRVKIPEVPFQIFLHCRDNKMADTSD